MLAHFVIRLLFGTCAMLCVMPRAAVPSAFFRIMMQFLLGLAVLQGLATEGDITGAVVMAVASFLSSVLWTLERRGGATRWMFIVLAVSLTEVVFSSRHLEQIPGLEQAQASSPAWTGLHLASDIASAAVLGAAMTGMLLGHRYLTAPGMPLQPLQRLNLWLGGVSVLRLILSAVALIWGWPLLTEPTWLIWLGLRWLAGIVGPLVCCWMVHQILKYRNTQAATGVLFVAVILTFIGELTADLLYGDLHLPL